MIAINFDLSSIAIGYENNHQSHLKGALYIQMRGAVNKFSGMLLRLILVISLVVPVTPAIASVLNIQGGLSEHKNCMSSMQTNSTASDGQAHAGKAAIKGHENCKDSCCPDGECICQGACLQLSASNNLPLFTGRNVTFSLQDEAASLSTDLGIHPSTIHYLPALRPPIC